MNKNKIIEEFERLSEGHGAYTVDRVWAMSFLLSIPTSILMELRGEVEGEAFNDVLESGQFSMHASGYNQAIEDILALIDKKIETLK